MDYKTATDRLAESVPLRDLAGALGVSHNTVVRARMDGPNARPAPAGWQAAVVALARKWANDLRARAARLDELADELSRQSAQ
jgi:hypothetical protein